MCNSQKRILDVVLEIDRRISRNDVWNEVQNLPRAFIGCMFMFWWSEKCLGQYLNFARYIANLHRNGWVKRIHIGFLMVFVVVEYLGALGHGNWKQSAGTKKIQ